MSHGLHVIWLYFKSDWNNFPFASYYNVSVMINAKFNMYEAYLTLCRQATSNFSNYLTKYLTTAPENIICSKVLCYLMN